MARQIIAFDKDRDRWVLSNAAGPIASSKRPQVLINRHPGADIDDLSAVQAHIAREITAGIIKEKKS